MIKIYSKNNCPKCQMTKQILSQHSINFSEINVEKDLTEEEFNEKISFFKNLNMMMFPVVEFVTEHGEKDYFSGFKPEKLMSFGK